MGDTTFKGGCFCGKIRIEYTGEPAMKVSTSLFSTLLFSTSPTPPARPPLQLQTISTY
jgi:hypothetical protein